MGERKTLSPRYLAAWYLSSAGLLVLLPGWKLGLPLWELPRSEWLPFACLGAAFAVSAGFAAQLRFAGRGRAFWLIVLSTIAVFGLVFLGFNITRTQFSRTITILTLLAALVLVPAPYVIGGSRV